MRYALLLLIATACARDSWPDGRYLYVQGDTAGITFDHVELFFGGHITNFLPHALPGYTKPTGATEELKRRVATNASSLQAIADAPVGHIDLALPPGLAQHNFGEYVLIIAYSGSTPVGIGARKDFADQPEDITRYEIALEPYPNDPAKFYRWGVDGDGPNCVRWQQGDEVTAVVREDDIDCDGYLDYQVDCDILTYCDGDCAPSPELQACASDDTGCVYGRCSNSRTTGEAVRTCAAELCLSPAACQAQCDGDSIDALLACELGAAHTATDIALPVSSALALCTTPEPFPIYLDLPDGFDCVAADTLAYGVETGTALDFTLKVIPLVMPVTIGNTIAECEIKMVENIHPTDMPPTIEEVFHVLVELDNGMGQYTSAIIGMTPQLGACDASAPPEVVVPVTVDEVATCP